MDYDAFLRGMPTRRARSCASAFNVPDDWQQLRKLGEGASGTVVAYRRQGKDYAVKKIADVFDSPSRAQRFLREITLLNHCQHKNIVSLHEVFLEGPWFSDAYLRMELMDTDLSLRIHDEGFPRLQEKQIDVILYQLLRAICCMHTAQIVHRDIKPSNVLVGAKGTIKLADFGLARVISVQDETPMEPCLTECVVTRYYRAPEVVLTGQKYGFPVDIWALGCIHGEMLTRNVLFRGQDSLEQVRKIITFVGNPTAADCEWIPSDSSSHGFVKLCDNPANGRGLEEIMAMPLQNDLAKGMFRSMLEFNPHKRPTVEEAVRHPCMRQFKPDKDDDVSAALAMPPIAKSSLALGAFAAANGTNWEVPVRKAVQVSVAKVRAQEMQDTSIKTRSEPGGGIKIGTGATEGGGIKIGTGKNSVLSNTEGSYNRARAPSRVVVEGRPSVVHASTNLTDSKLHECVSIPHGKSEVDKIKERVMSVSDFLNTSPKPKAVNAADDYKFRYPPNVKRNTTERISILLEVGGPLESDNITPLARTRTRTNSVETKLEEVCKHVKVNGRVFAVAGQGSCVADSMVETKACAWTETSGKMEKTLEPPSCAANFL